MIISILVIVKVATFDIAVRNDSLNYRYFYNNQNDQLYYQYQTLIRHTEIITVSIILQYISQH